MMTALPTATDGAPSNSNPVPSGPSYASLLTLQELVSRVVSQVQAAHGEIGETRAILQDAIERLMPAFTLVKAAGAATSDNAVVTEKTCPIEEAAFNALQFQDISDQLLAHAQCRLSALICELDDLTNAVAPTTVFQNAAAQNNALSSHLISQVERINDNLAELDLSLSKPVSKAHLGVGEMELF
jgi:hypothetical protein